MALRACALCLALAGCGGGSAPGPAPAPAAPADADHDTVLDVNDCAPADGTRWRFRPYESADLDSDTHLAGPAGQVCAGAALPPAYSALPAVAAGVDCNDTNAAVWRLMMVYPDADGDGVGAGSGSVACVGLHAATGFSLGGYDPLDDPADPAAATVSDFDVPTWLLTPIHDI